MKINTSHEPKHICSSATDLISPMTACLGVCHGERMTQEFAEGAVLSGMWKTESWNGENECKAHTYRTAHHDTCGISH